MTLHEPFKISARLLPALQIADGWISLKYLGGRDNEGRTNYRWYIDIPAGEFDGADLKSGCNGGNLQEGFESLLSFLNAAAESYRYRMRMREDSNTDLFPQPVVEWAYQNCDEISMLELEIQETETKLIEE